MTEHNLPSTISKSRFKLALECPRKLAYTSDSRYVSTKDSDELLEALADGGHKVGALAKLMFPDGVEIQARTTKSQLAETDELLKHRDIVIFEATFEVDGLLARVDVLVKQGGMIQLVEVKSKGFNPGSDSFRTKTGGIDSGWRSYLYDVAFQALVLRRARPKWRVRPFLMLVDTSVPSSVDGLGTKFILERDDTDPRRVSVHVERGFEAAELTPPLLRMHEVTAEVDELLAGPVPTETADRPLQDFVDSLAAQLEAGHAPEAAYGKQCRACEFYVEPGGLEGEQRSGWHECMQAIHGTPVTLSRSQTVFGLANCRYLGRLLDQGRFALETLEEGDLDANTSPDEILLPHRHRLQASEVRDGTDRFLCKRSIRDAYAGLSWPLHFIDFETARPVLPFHLGHRPNQQLLFQCSHHILTLDGKLRHATQSLVAQPGVDPSFQVLRELRDALGGSHGSVVHWWDHERSVLKDLAQQLAGSMAPDRDELRAFIDSLVGNGHASGRLFDLGRLVQRAAFFAGTSGRSSIKKVLPAVMRQSPLLRVRYGASSYGTMAMPSLNYPVGRAWWIEQDGEVVDPYSLLGPRFADSLIEHAVEQGEADEVSRFVANGGAAMVAYGELQRRDLPQPQRDHLRQQLLRYCELDTLAMVMVYEALADWVRGE